MSQRDIRSLFGKKLGGGDDEKKESERVLQKEKKRKDSQQEYESKRRKRSLQEAWFDEFPWAEKDDQKLFCKVCRKYPNLADTKSSLYIGISSNFRKETLKFHDKSFKHRKCVDHQKVIETPSTSSFAKSVKKVD